MFAVVSLLLVFGTAQVFARARNVHKLKVNRALRRSVPRAPTLRILFDFSSIKGNFPLHRAKLENSRGLQAGRCDLP